MVQNMKLTFSTYQGNGKLAGMPFQRGSLRLRAKIHKMAEQHPAGRVNFEEIFGMPLDSQEKAGRIFLKLHGFGQTVVGNGNGF